MMELDDDRKGSLRVERVSGREVVGSALGQRRTTAAFRRRLCPPDKVLSKNEPNEHVKVKPV
jgi:hypothetical protein